LETKKKEEEEEEEEEDICLWCFVMISVLGWCSS
jgi:hypothetical protein